VPILRGHAPVLTAPRIAPGIARRDAGVIRPTPMI